MLCAFCKSSPTGGALCEDCRRKWDTELTRVELASLRRQLDIGIRIYGIDQDPVAAEFVAATQSELRETQRRLQSLTN